MGGSFIGFFRFLNCRFEKGVASFLLPPWNGENGCVAYYYVPHARGGHFSGPPGGYGVSHRPTPRIAIMREQGRGLIGPAAASTEAPGGEGGASICPRLADYAAAYKNHAKVMILHRK